MSLSKVVVAEVPAKLAPDIGVAVSRSAVNLIEVKCDDILEEAHDITIRKVDTCDDVPLRGYSMASVEMTYPLVTACGYQVSSGLSSDQASC